MGTALTPGVIGAIASVGIERSGELAKLSHDGIFPEANVVELLDECAHASIDAVEVVLEIDIDVRVGVVTSVRQVEDISHDPPLNSRLHNASDELELIACATIGEGGHHRGCIEGCLQLLCLLSESVSLEDQVSA